MVGIKTGYSFEITKTKNMIRDFAFSTIVFLFSLSAGAQKIDTIRVPAIPHGLFWENAPKSFSVKGDEIVIVAGGKTDMFRDPNVAYNTDNAPKLLFEGDENFVFTASIEHAFANKWDGGAIVIKQDSLNWIKFCFEKDYTGAKRVVSVVTKDISDDCNSEEMVSNRVYYKVAKADQVITLYCSKDGIKWFLVRHLQFDARKGFKLGFLAQSPTGDRCEVKFSNIFYKTKKIKDPYLGE
jgi:regulation of enolase protein 1 (concanavalin A-like superfamily)